MSLMLRLSPLIRRSTARRRPEARRMEHIGLRGEMKEDVVLRTMRARVGRLKS